MESKDDGEDVFRFPNAKKAAGNLPPCELN